MLSCATALRTASTRPARIVARVDCTANGAETPFRWRKLEDLSPVVRSLAHEQFDDLVKQVRVFVAADVAEAIRGCGSLEDLLLEAAQPA